MRKNILFILFIPMFILVALIVFFNVSTYNESLNSSIKQRLDIESQLIFREVELALCNDSSWSESGNPIFFSKLDTLIKEYDHVELLWITSKDGIYLYSYPSDALQNEQAVKTKARNFFGVNPLIYEKTHSIDCKQHGRCSLTLVLKANSASVLAKVNFIINIFVVALFFISIYFAVSSWISNALERPLALMLSAQEKLAKGEYDARLHTELARSSELLQTYSSFNNMAGELQHSRTELEEKNRELASLNADYRHLNEKLEQEVQLKTAELREYFSLITHDLKVPLAAANGYVELLLKSKTGELNDKQLKFLQSISVAHAYLLNLLRNMVDSVKYEADKITYFFENFDLITLVTEIENTMLPSFKEKNLTLTISADRENPLFVNADRLKIAQVLSNLLSNAVKISEENSSIVLRVVEYEEYVQISVADFGAGISEENISRIFNKFAQFFYGDKSYEGIGLGLYIVNKIIEGHHKTISVISKPGEGTTFTFQLDKSGKA